MRIAHFTDIHYTLLPEAAELSPKRALGTVNLVLGRRIRHFDPDVQARLVQSVLDQAPDAVVISGDLTGTALEREFLAAKAGLGALLDAVPTLVLPGNHDRYTHGATRTRRLEAHFGAWTHQRDDGLAALELPGLDIIGLDPNRPTGLHASGLVPASQLAALDAWLTGRGDDARPWLLALHYPVVDRQGAIYDNAGHGLRNARALLEVLRAGRTKPLAILHGHVHHGYSARVDVGEMVTTLNPGTAGYHYDARKRRSASFCVYEVEGSSLIVRRFQDDGTRFNEESPAFSGGR